MAKGFITAAGVREDSEGGGPAAAQTGEKGTMFEEKPADPRQFGVEGIEGLLEMIVQGGQHGALPPHPTPKSLHIGTRPQRPRVKAGVGRGSRNGEGGQDEKERQVARGKGRQRFAPPRGLGRATKQEEGAIAPKPGGETFEGFPLQRMAKERVGKKKAGRGVGTPPPKPRPAGDFLVQAQTQGREAAPRRLLEEHEGPGSEVAAAGRHPLPLGPGDDDLPKEGRAPGAGLLPAGNQLDPVGKINGKEDRVEVVVAVRPPAEDIEEKIHLCRCVDFGHGSP